MPIKKEFKCMAHGFFEAVTDDEMPRCPSGCTIGIERAFLTPQSIRGNSRTKNIDKTFAELARDFNLSDISNRGGDSVMHNNLRMNPLSKEARDYRPQWHAIQGNAEGKVDMAQVMAQHGVSSDDGGAFQTGQFQQPTMIPDQKLTFGDKSMLAGAVAEGQKANQ